VQLTLPERGIPDGRLLLERDQLAGHGYRVKVQVCDNPVCECKRLTLHCFPETEVTPSAEIAKPLSLEMDLGKRSVEQPAGAAPTLIAALARAVASEITHADWAFLWRYYFALKVVYTEHADLDKIEASFPPNAGEGGMVGYYETLPFARPVSFTAAEKEWVFDDQYCLRPDCRCRAAVLQCFLVSSPENGGTPKGPDLSIRYHYDTGRFETIETEGTFLSAEAFLDGMRKVQPKLDAFLAKRHSQLRHLYRSFLSRNATPTRASASKPGRNDPCPCGSGMKYKKCCGKG
jgi:hypothetical protein